MAYPNFQLFRSDSNGEYYFRLNAVNGQTILQSEGYTTVAACQNGIESVKVNSGLLEQYDKKRSKDGQYYFNLTARNGQVIGVSEMYTTNSACDNGIEAVMRDAPRAQVEVEN